MAWRELEGEGKCPLSCLSLLPSAVVPSNSGVRESQEVYWVRPLNPSRTYLRTKM